MGLPMYVAIDQKPENGCEIQNSAYGRSGIILWIRFAKTAEEIEAEHVNEYNDGLIHVTQVLKTV